MSLIKNPQADGVGECLGMSEEREMQLFDFLVDLCFKKAAEGEEKFGITELLEATVEKFSITDPAEFFMLGWMISNIAEQINGLQGIHAALKCIVGNKEREQEERSHLQA